MTKVSYSIVENIMKRNDFEGFDRLCVFIALVHDIGKFTPLFQSKLLELLPEFRNQTSDYGFEISRHKDFLDPNKSPHEYADEAILLKYGCPQGGDIMESCLTVQKYRRSSLSSMKKIFMVFTERIADKENFGKKFGRNGFQLH